VVDPIKLLTAEEVEMLRSRIPPDAPLDAWPVRLVATLDHWLMLCKDRDREAIERAVGVYGSP